MSQQLRHPSFKHFTDLHDEDFVFGAPIKKHEKLQFQ